MQAQKPFAPRRAWARRSSGSARRRRWDRSRPDLRRHDPGEDDLLLTDEMRELPRVLDRGSAHIVDDVGHAAVLDGEPLGDELAAARGDQPVSASEMLGQRHRRIARREPVVEDVVDHAPVPPEHRRGRRGTKQVVGRPLEGQPRQTADRPRPGIGETLEGTIESLTVRPPLCGGAGCGTEPTAVRRRPERDGGSRAASRDGGAGGGAVAECTNPEGDDGSEDVLTCELGDRVPHSDLVIDVLPGRLQVHAHHPRRCGDLRNHQAELGRIPLEALLLSSLTEQRLDTGGITRRLDVVRGQVAVRRTEIALVRRVEDQEERCAVLGPHPLRSLGRRLRGTSGWVERSEIDACLHGDQRERWVYQSFESIDTSLTATVVNVAMSSASAIQRAPRPWWPSRAATAHGSRAPGPGHSPSRCAVLDTRSPSRPRSPTRRRLTAIAVRRRPHRRRASTMSMRWRRLTPVPRHRGDQVEVRRAGDDHPRGAVSRPVIGEALHPSRGGRKRRSDCLGASGGRGGE